MRTDVIVLGAGMVGISAALALQARGRKVSLVDRRPAAEETSYGNAGLIQREGVVPYAFPRDFAKLLRYALNQAPEANLHWRALPWLAPFLTRYWYYGAPERVAATARAARPLVERCIEEHLAFTEAAGVAHLLRKSGYLKVFRSASRYEAELCADEAAKAAYGVTSLPTSPAEIAALEPHLTGDFAGGLLMPQPVTVSDPGAIGRAYAELFTARGGTFVTADASMLRAVPKTSGGGWQVARVEGAITAPAVVVALGPWSGDLVGRLGVSIPMAVKRGYHMHYAVRGNAVLERPVIDGDNGFVLSTMTRGIRLTTGAEFALRDAPPTPVQLDRVEPAARALFPLAGRVDAQPWLGSRPVFPDMLPMIGEVPGKPGLWLDCGHHHLGFTLGPVSGRLLAELMTGAEPFTDPTPYRVARFG